MLSFNSNGLSLSDYLHRIIVYHEREGYEEVRVFLTENSRNSGLDLQVAADWTVRKITTLGKIRLVFLRTPEDILSMIEQVYTLISDVTYSNKRILLAYHNIMSAMLLNREYKTHSTSDQSVEDKLKSLCELFCLLSNLQLINRGKVIWNESYTTEECTSETCRATLWDLKVNHLFDLEIPVEGEVTLGHYLVKWFNLTQI